MAATPKHRRSSSKARSTRASNRYDVELNKARKMKKFGGKFATKSGDKFILSHRVSKANPEYKNIKVIDGE